MSNKEAKIFTSYSDTSVFAKLGSSPIDRIQDEEGRLLYDTGGSYGSYFTCLNSDSMKTINSYRPKDEEAILRQILEVVHSEPNSDIIRHSKDYSIASSWTESSPLKHLCNPKSVRGTTPSH